MREYLTQDEKMQVIALYHLAKRLEQIIDNESAFTKDERTNYKKAHTWLLKGCRYVLNRLDLPQAKSMQNLLETTSAFVDYKSVIARMMKGIEDSVDKGYEDNQNYFQLVENVLYNNCRDCNKCKDDCTFYAIFEDKNIPGLDGADVQENCKYAYKEVR